jgi:UDP-N-acetylmuramate--alanine ligase
VFIHNPKHPELLFAQKNDIRISKRDECLNMVIKQKSLKLIAVSGTHGKTSATAMLIWLFKQIGEPISYSVGAKLSFGPMGNYDPKSKYFAYECDEFDHNFLNFKPQVSIITSVDWDHHEIYPTRQSYKKAFLQFISQSQQTYLFNDVRSYLALEESHNLYSFSSDDNKMNLIKLPGKHNRQNAFLCLKALVGILNINFEQLAGMASKFPGASRRFEKIANNIYSDYGHTPEEITATLQAVSELNKDFIVIYEPLTDRRQHYMKELYNGIFDGAKKVYWLPSYLAREDPNTPILSPKELITYLGPNTRAEAALKNNQLKNAIINAASNNTMVICIAGGGGGSLDEWARKYLTK